ncbi:hypothetical protein CU097_011665 [Rhizopus azygosporus]|uniref:Uncharacterized protein n=1 Tax=Rhizopus azygosporus TaxID=86630 RepID=A0A367KAU3_RHIAZ|nr:hypothetical protein CU097_011665 [Rhizopus azygosporus]
MSAQGSPESVLIYYCPFLPNRPVPHVNKITKMGCSGQLMLEKKSTDYVLQLLGLYESNETPEQVKQKRFGTMPIETINFTSDCDMSPIKSTIKLIDFTDFKEAWTVIDEACALDRPDTLVCIVSLIQLKSSPSIIPQSYLMKGGTRLEEEEIDHSQSLIYSYLHPGSTRVDFIEHFGQDIIRTNNKILAWHFLAEIGNKLGYIAKYGA